MAHLRYSSYPGFGEENFERAHYSSAVRVPPGETIQISGQGGWDRTTSVVHADLSDEINQAFDNVHHALVYAGSNGLPSVYKLVIYYAPISDDAVKFTIENLRQRFPNHRPLLTALGIEKLALPGMRIEIEAWAHMG